MAEWLERYGVKRQIIPGLFDLTELWQLNSTRFPGFNIVFFPLYIVFVAAVLPYTALCLMEAVLKWLFENK